MSKPRVIKDYDKLDEAILEQIKQHYPFGFENHLIIFKNATGALVSALPFETEDRYYLVRMTKAEAQEIIEEDDDYNEEGELIQETTIELTDDFDVVDDSTT